MATRLTISVVDDNASVRAAMSTVLGKYGYVVHTFRSAEEFLASPQLNDTACVISDMQMPSMSGLDLLTHLRMQGHTMPFILVTAFPDESIRARALEAGASGFLVKPFALAKLTACLDAALAA